MPNTIAHLGIQGLLSRRLLPWAEVRWVFLGCIIPDLPWIVQRVVRQIMPSIDPLDLRVYVIAQASLFISLLACVAFASLSARPRRVLTILGVNVVLHLLVDAAQTKWGNGVHLFAPFAWQDLNFGLFWPESVVTYALTALGLGYWLWVSARRRESDIHLIVTRGRHLGMAGAAFLAWLVLPVLLLPGVEIADSHSVATIREQDARVGRTVSFDRVYYEPRPDGGVLFTIGGDEVNVIPALSPEADRLSARGVFVAPDTVEVHEVHWHSQWPRDMLSMAGLIMVALVWIPPDWIARMRRITRRRER